MSGTDPDHHVHVTHRGEPAFLGLAFHAGSHDDLARLAKATARSVEPLREPGGGSVVRLTDPDGRQIDVVYGIEQFPVLPLRTHAPLNTGAQRLRAGTLQRIQPGPSQPKRCGHAAIKTTNLATLSRWYDEHLGLLVSDDISRDDVALTIRTISPWTMTCQVAERYRDGRVFLVGDAAHRFPPTGGLGLNTGVQDVHNLVWKLAAVEAGEAQPALLETYEVERQPVARYNADQSLQNAMRLFEVPQALGFSDDPQTARTRFAETIADPARRRNLVAAIENQAEHFDMLGLQLGFAYETGALVPDGTDKVAPPNPVREFVPTSRPGARLPHGWVQCNGRRASTLDLIAIDRLTLLAGRDGAAWVEAAHVIAPSLHCVQLGRDVDDPSDWWTLIAEMRVDGALLVRPDQHVAFRSRSDVADPQAALAHAVAAVFGHRE